MPPNTNRGGDYMGGSYHYDKKAKRYYVSIYWYQKHYRIFRYNGEPIWHEKTADKLLSKIRVEVDEGTFQPKAYFPDSPLSIKEYSKQWLEAIDVSKKTRSDYRTAVNKYIIPFFQEKDIRHIRHNDLVLFYKQIPGSKKWQYNVMGVLKSMLRWAYRNEDISKVPPFPKLSYDPPADIPYLTLEQQESVLKAIPERHRPIFMIMMEYGLRIGEGRAIMKDCVTEDRLIIKRAFSDNDLKETTKTGQVRVYGLTTYAKEILNAMPVTFSPFVFAREDGRPYTNKNLNTIWRNACKKAVIEIKLYNAVRHSLGCQLLDEGKDMSFVRDVLGHTRDEMTRRYAKRTSDILTRGLENRRKIIDIREARNN